MFCKNSKTGEVVEVNPYSPPMGKRFDSIEITREDLKFDNFDKWLVETGFTLFAVPDE